MKSLTNREFVVAHVAADLLCKGNPCTRIAKYCLYKGMTEKQIRIFCDKMIDFGVDIRREVIEAVHNLQLEQHKNEPDISICFGNRLKKRLGENTYKVR